MTLKHNKTKDQVTFLGTNGDKLNTGFSSLCVSRDFLPEYFAWTSDVPKRPTSQ